MAARALGVSVDSDQASRSSSFRPAPLTTTKDGRPQPPRATSRARARAARRAARSPGARDAGGGGGERKRGEFGGEGGPRKTGVCVAWNHKGFGFIRPDDGQGDDLFCHATQIRDGFMRRPSRKFLGDASELLRDKLGMLLLLLRLHIECCPSHEMDA